MSSKDKDKYRAQILEGLLAQPTADAAKQEEYTQLLKLLDTHRRTLAHYLNQEAALGAAYAPPALANGIYEAREQIKQLKQTLRGQGLPIEDRPGDEPPAHPLSVQPPSMVQPRTLRSYTPWMLGGAIALIGLALLVFWFPRGSGGTTVADSSASPTAQVAIAPAPSAAPAPTTAPKPSAPVAPTPLPTVEPVAAGKYMVLVSQIEQLGTQTRPTTRFIAESLKRTFQVDLPASKIEVRTYPAIVTSAEQAGQAAETAGAPLIVWGTDDGQQALLNIQVGAIDRFPLIQVDRDTLDRTANVQVALKDPRQQSIAPQVLAALNVLYVADGNAYGNGRILELLGRMQVSSPDTEGSATAPTLQRYMRRYFNDTAGAIDEITAAIENDPRNPLLFVYRGSALVRLGRYDEANEDAATAEQLDSSGQWGYPSYIHALTAFFAGDLDQAMTQYDRVVKLRPNDWLPIEFHGFIAYWKGDYKLARTEADRSIALDPAANFPYLLRIALDLHAGELEDAATQAAIVTKKFPDPNAGDRLLSAFFGDKRNASIAALTAVGNLLLGRLNDVVRETEEPAQAGNAPAELYLARGLAQCARQQYKEAEQSYTSGIAVDPSFILLYLLRAESRLKQENVAGATEDVGAIQQSNQAATLAPYIKAAQTGQFSCQTLLGAAP